MSWSPEESSDISGLPGCCPGCQLPWTSCVCTTPWSEHRPGPEYLLNLHDPPAFWRKKDRDDWYDELRRNGWA